MAGHSKWANIKRRKGAQDAKRGKIFGKLIREISVAARQGGADPDANPRLRTAITTAKAENMPLDNITRAIEKATSAGQGEDWFESSYEGYGPGGAAILVDTLTDNKNRTTGEVRHVFTKYDCNLGSANCVAWMFERKGYIVVNKDAAEEDKLMELVLEAGADDLEDSDEYWEITSAPEAFDEVVKALESAGIETEEAKLAKIPENMTKVDGKDADKLMKMLEALEDLDDVQNVWTNFDSED